MVPDSQLDRALTLQADAVMGSLLDFKPEEWGLPPYSANV